MLGFEFMPTKKERVMFLCDKETRDQIQSWADEEGRSISNLIERVILSVLKNKSSGVEGTPTLPPTDRDDETLDLLIDFLNYLIDNFDHDGFSLAEISQLLGRPDDKGLVRLVQKLQNGQSQPKSGVKQR